jgi:hypothetical protein
MMGNLPCLSVVIATLGDAQIARTISEINQGILKPAEVLICIPENEAARVRELRHDNLRIIYTKFRGQVAQRAEGLRQACCPVVMQLDDDVTLDFDSVEIMVRSLLTLGHGHVVGPVFYNKITGNPLSKMENGALGLFHNLYETIVRGLPWGRRRMGALSSIAGCGSVDPRCFDTELVSTAWLPGGCLISFREDLILESFYPFEGKSYSEDLLHSCLRSRIGIRHFVVKKARATVMPPARGMTKDSAIAEILARRYVAKELGGNQFRAILAAIMDLARRQVALALTRKSIK